MARPARSPVSRPRRTNRDGFPLRLKDELVYELSHLVRLLEPLEQSGGLQVPGLATLNGARAVLAKAKPYSESDLVRDTLADLEEKPRAKSRKVVG